jgi:hypothetical protein
LTVARTVAEWLASAEKIITEAVNETVQEMAPEAARLLQGNIPGNRKKTKASVKHMMTGARSAKIGLFFAEKYTDNKNSFTYRLFRQVWRDKVRPEIRAKFIRTLNNKLQR